MSLATLTPMTETEARTCAGKIREHHKQARGLFLEFFQRDGWKVLGYDSVAACIEKEFPFSRATYYNMISREGIRADIGIADSLSVPDKMLAIIKPVPPEDRRAVWEQATSESGQEVPDRAILESCVNRHLCVPAALPAPPAGPKEPNTPPAEDVPPAPADDMPPGPVVKDPDALARDLGILNADDLEPAIPVLLSTLSRDDAMAVVRVWAPDGVLKASFEELHAYVNDGPSPGDDGAMLPAHNSAQVAAAEPVREGPPASSKVVEVEHTVREAGADPLAGHKALRNEDWVATLAVRSKLAPGLVEAFDRDACFWRHSRKAVMLCQRQTRDEIQDTRKHFHGLERTPFVRRFAYLFRWRGPQEWQACADCRGEESGLSSGTRVLLGKIERCGTCAGTGYLVK